MLTNLGLFQAIISAIVSAVMILVNAFNPAMKPFEPSPEIPEVNTQAMMNFIGDGIQPYKIIISRTAAETEKTAAATLQKYISQMTGVTLEILEDTARVSENEILIGKTTREGGRIIVDRSALKNDGYIIKGFGTKLVISGAGTRGTIYGVYAFLEDVLGCHWYAKDLIEIPKKTTVQIPTALNIQRNAYFECRDTDWESPKDVEYSLANRLNSCVYRRPSAAQGGCVNYLSNFCHTLTTQFASADTYFASHPEYYAYREDDGARVPKQLCLTNPAVVDLVTNEVLSLLERTYDDTTSDVQIVSLTQHDNTYFCQCDKCKALDEKEGSHAGTMINFINQIAARVRDAGYTNVAIDTFAYQYTRTPPKTIVPLDNVIVRLCSIECCFSHTFSDPGCKENRHFMSDLEGWGKICDRIYIWDYTTNYANYLGLFPDFGVLQENMQTFYENGVKGVYEEGNYTASQCDGEFSDLRAYLLSKLMWDPYLDYDKTMNGFLKAYYGDGWQYMREFIDTMTKNTGNNDEHMKIYSSMNYKGTLNLSLNEVDYCNDLWKNAKEKAGTDWQRNNVERSELAWRYWKGCNNASEFSRLQPRSKWMGEHEKLYNDMVSFGIVRFNESKMLTTTPDFSLRPSNWGASVS